MKKKSSLIWVSGRVLLFFYWPCVQLISSLTWIQIWSFPWGPIIFWTEKSYVKAIFWISKSVLKNRKSRSKFYLNWLSFDWFWSIFQPFFQLWYPFPYFGPAYSTISFSTNFWKGHLKWSIKSVIRKLTEKYFF